MDASLRPSLPLRPVPRRLYAPQWWPAWLGLGLLRLLALLPVPLLRALGAGLGELFHALVPSRRRIVRINLRLCFPELDEAARRRLARAHFHALGMGFAELLLAWFASDRRLRLIAEYSGLEHLRAVSGRRRSRRAAARQPPCPAHGNARAPDGGAPPRRARESTGAD